jgi:hypothetical protein
MWGTEQGGPAASPVPSLRYVQHLGDNANHGLAYGRFTQKCGLITGVPQAEGNSRGGSPFLDVPLHPAWNIPTLPPICG